MNRLAVLRLCHADEPDICSGVREVRVPESRTRVLLLRRLHDGQIYDRFSNKR